ncbi:hypothetical protein ABZ953_19355 [Streptomyces sp. NPDC046465]|uniref:hypothetical protein n=1 Tax=Streptomyces sp. NPDC046465 TaxID=3155810 RepID=UPI0033EF39B7
MSAAEKGVTVDDAWEVHVELLLAAPAPDWPELCEQLMGAMGEAYEFVATATAPSPDGPAGAVAAAGGVFQVEGMTPGQAVDLAVTETRRALGEAGFGTRGVAEVKLLPGGVDPRTLV